MKQTLISTVDIVVFQFCYAFLIGENASDWEDNFPHNIGSNEKQIDRPGACTFLVINAKGGKNGFSFSV